MKQLLVYNIGMMLVDNHHKPFLAGGEMAGAEILRDAWLLVEDERIKDFGEGDAPSDLSPQTSDHRPQTTDLQSIDAQGGAVLPSFCDSHTPLVYAGSREGEFVDKIRGMSYAEIARRGGGILNSADRLHAMSEDELYGQAMQRVDEIVQKGTGAVEIKSGYGLNTEDELKMLRVIRRIRETAPLKVVSTFLGAHAVGRGYTHEQYVDLVVGEMIPEVARQGLADFIDVFCDEGFFTPADTRRILMAGLKHGLRGKIHGQELADSGGVEVAVECGTLSVDHLESMTDRDIKLLTPTDLPPKGKTPAPSNLPSERGWRGVPIPTVLPGTSFFLNMPFAPARKMIDSGLPVAIASDYNPGSTPSGDMKFAVSLACIKQRLLPVEAIHAATLNSACAMGLSHDYGSIARGKKANFYVTDPVPSLDFLPYAYTTPVIRQVFLSSE